MGLSRETKLRSDKYNKNIEKRGNVPAGAVARRNVGYSTGPIMLGFLIFVVIGSTFFQIIRNTQSGVVLDFDRDNMPSITSVMSYYNERTLVAYIYGDLGKKKAVVK
eukprot:gene10193-21243_t